MCIGQQKLTSRVFQDRENGNGINNSNTISCWTLRRRTGEKGSWCGGKREYKGVPCLQGCRLEWMVEDQMWRSLVGVEEWRESTRRLLWDTSLVLGDREWQASRNARGLDSKY